mgnify:CR=1 FL=1
MNSIDKNWVDTHVDSNGEVIIPEGIEKIEAEAFIDNQLVKKVVMPNTIVEIGANAFTGCINLVDIQFSNNLRTIGADAFLDCKKITSVELPKTLEVIGEEAFARCEELEKVLIDYEAKIKEIQDAIFYECKKLKTISLPKATEKIGGYAFYECSSLDTISIPDSIEEIGANAFSYCSALQNIEIGENSQLRNLGERAFYLCKELQKIKLPDGLKTLEKAIFAGCYKLSSVDLGNGIETLGYDVFNSCRSLKSITLPDSLRKIGAASFLNCENLTNVNGGQNIEEIEAGAFEKSNIATFNVPSQVKIVDYKVLGDCTNLSELYLGENTEGLASMALSGCTNLKKLSINEQLSYFPETALEGVDSLEEVVINGTSRINYNSFKGKSSIRKITIDGNEYSLDENEELFSIQKHGSNAAIVVTDKDGLKRTRCINLEKGTETKQNVNIYLANDGSVVRSIKSTAYITIEQLKQLKQRGEQKVYVYGSTRDIKPYEHESEIEYDLYNIDDLIQIKTIIEEIKQGITVPPKDDKHRQKKIYSQLVRKLSETLEYDFFEEYMNASSEAEKEAEKVKYEKMTQGKWEDYLEQNKGRNIEKTMLEDGNLLGLINGRAVCRGNVEIIRNLAAEFGIETLGIIGAKHTWNQVKLDGMWYDDDFTNYQSYLAQGNLDKSIKRFLCGQVDGKSEFSKLKTYSRTLNRPQEVGKNYSVADKKFLLNYGRVQQKAQQQVVQPHEKERPPEESIKDEVGDETKTKTQSQQQDEQQAEAIWMNRLQTNNDNVARMQDGAKKQQDVVKLIQDLDREHRQDRNQQIQEENQNNGQGR